MALVIDEVDDPDNTKFTTHILAQRLQSRGHLIAMLPRCLHRHGRSSRQIDYYIAESWDYLPPSIDGALTSFGSQRAYLAAHILTLAGCCIMNINIYCRWLAVASEIDPTNTVARQ